MISYQTFNVKMPPIRRRDVSAWVRRVAAGYGKRVGEVAYIFCDDEKILEVNRQYLNHDYYTDIITIARTTPSRATSSSASTPCAATPRRKARPTMRNSTAS